VQANKQVEEWSARARDLMTKKVDLAEHEKALTQLKEDAGKLAEMEKAKKEAEDEAAGAREALAAEQKKTSEVCPLCAKKNE
jgi:DNA repair exonuclease SbcCD ATPase subunit